MVSQPIKGFKKVSSLVFMKRRGGTKRFGEGIGILRIASCDKDRKWRGFVCLSFCWDIWCTVCKKLWISILVELWTTDSFCSKERAPLFAKKTNFFHVQTTSAVWIFERFGHTPKRTCGFRCFALGKAMEVEDESGNPWSVKNQRVALLIQKWRETCLPFRKTMFMRKGISSYTLIPINWRSIAQHLKKWRFQKQAGWEGRKPTRHRHGWIFPPFAGSSGQKTTWMTIDLWHHLKWLQNVVMKRQSLV